MTCTFQDASRHCATAGAFLVACTLLLAGVGAAFAAPGAAPPPVVRILRTGAPQPVFVWNAMHCEDWDIPDTAARAWRDAQGQTHLLATDATNRAMIGTDLDHLRHDCRVVFKGGEQDAPERYDDRSWIASTYTLDGKTVRALVHNEFHGQLRPALCPSRDYAKCWSNTLTLAESHDGGLSFAHAAAPRHFVAGLPYRYRGDIGHRTGYFNPSNIIARDGFYYAFFWAEADGAQQRGACLMRTADLGDPSAWRGWNGTEFSVRFVDPYVDEVQDPAAHVCAPVAPASLVSFVSSVTRDRASGAYIALMATVHSPSPGAAATPGIYAAASTDLIHWSAPVLLWQEAVLFKYECSDREAVFYPSLLDPNASTRNFEDTGRHAFLYFTAIHLAGCRIGTDRDLMRVPVDISVELGRS